MSKYCVAFVAACLLFLLSGCAGSSSSSSGGAGAEGGIPLSQYQATLPGGAQMEVEILANDGRAWAGEFGVAAETGPYAFQTGTFAGTISGNSATATCEAEDGTTFQLTGTVNGDASLQLTRSDIPGTVLNFTPVAALAATSRAETGFNMTASGITVGSTGRVTLPTSPNSIQGGGTMSEYRGTWLGLNVTFWSYSTGFATLVIYINDYAVCSVNFASYKLTDFGTVTQTTSSGRVSIYSPVTKTQFQFPNSVKVSP